MTGNGAAAGPETAALRAWAQAHARTVGRTGVQVMQTANTVQARWGRPGAYGRRASFHLYRDLVGVFGEIWCLAWSADPDRPLLASGSAAPDSGFVEGGRGAVQIWDPGTGECLHTLPVNGDIVDSVEWSPHPGRPLLAATGSDRSARIWDPVTGQCLRTLTGHTDLVWSVTWSPDPDHPLLATASRDQSVRIWDPETGRCLRVLGVGRYCNSVAWSPHPGRRLIATSGAYIGADIWDADSGEHLHALRIDDGDINVLAWSPPGGRPLLATCGQHHSVHIWDPDTGRCVRAITSPVEVWEIAWSPHADGPLLAANDLNRNARLRFWDPQTGEPVAALDDPEWWNVNAFGALADGRIALAAGYGESGSIRIWVDEQPGVDDTPAVTIRTAARTSAEIEPARVSPSAVYTFLTLGSAGHWIPLGLLADLMTLAAHRADAAPRLNDPRLSPLARHPVFRRFQDLRWPASAYGTVAALLTVDERCDPAFEPDPGFVPADDSAFAEWHTALVDALATPVTEARPAAVPSPQQVAAGLDAVTDKTFTLLRILGPGAVTADPLLPLRLGRHTSGLPELTSVQATLLAAASAADPTRTELRVITDTTRFDPDTSGITRRGPLTTATPTQLALPAPLLLAKYAENDLLHRARSSPAPTPRQPLALVLDTTPPTYGPCETILRLVAHLITTTLWHGGQRTTLITTTDPHRLHILAAAADLPHLWTSRTLSPPYPALREALRTAVTRTTHPVLVLTTVHTARQYVDDRLLVPAPGLQLLTAHIPGRTPSVSVPVSVPVPVPVPESRHHHQLPTDAHAHQLISRIRHILDTAADARKAPGPPDPGV